MQPIARQAVSQLIRYYVDRLPTDVDGGCAGDAYVGAVILAAERAWHRGAKMGRFQEVPGRAIDRVNGVVLRSYVYDVNHLTCNCLTCHKRLSVDLIVQQDRSEQLEGRGRNG